MPIFRYYPRLEDDELKARYDRVKPLVVHKDGNLWEIAPISFEHIRKIAYLWEPAITNPAPPMVYLQSVRGFFAFGYYGLFKPDIAEVLEQIPLELVVEDYVYFTITKGPGSHDDLHREQEAFNRGYHVAKINFYKMAL